MFYLHMYREIWLRRQSHKKTSADVRTTLITTIIAFVVILAFSPQINTFPWIITLEAWLLLLGASLLIEPLSVAAFALHWTLEASLQEEYLCLNRQDILLTFGRYGLQHEPNWQSMEVWQVKIWLRKMKEADPRRKIIAFPIRKNPATNR